MSIALLLACASTLKAQDPPTSPAQRRPDASAVRGRSARFYSQLRQFDVPKVDVPQPVFPKRRLTFEVLEVAEKRQTSAESIESDSDFFQKYRYEAMLVLRGAQLPGRFEPTTKVEHAYESVGNPWGVFQTATYGFVTLSDEQFLARVPKDLLPRSDIVKELPALQSVGGGGMGNLATPSTEFVARLYAPTVERAKELTEALLLIYDNGVVAPLLKADETLKRQHRILAEGYRKALAEAEKAVEQSQKELDELKDYQDLSKEVLTNLTTQLWQIAVERAGIEARILACEKLLTPRKDGTYSVAPEDTIKIKAAAEIDLAGLVAREAAVKNLVAKGRNRRELAGSLFEAQVIVRGEQQRIDEGEKAIAFYEDQLKRYHPFPVVDNKVTIRPVKWELTKGKK